MTEPMAESKDLTHLEYLEERDEVLGMTSIAPTAVLLSKNFKLMSALR